MKTSDIASNTRAIGWAASNAEQVSTAVLHNWTVQVRRRRNDCTGHGFPQSQDANAGFLGPDWRSVLLSRSLRSADGISDVSKDRSDLPTFRKIL